MTLIQDAGLRNRRVFETFLWLTFPPTNCRRELCVATDFITVNLDHAKMQEFHDYILEPYIDEGAKAAPSIFCCISSTIVRTTTSRESFHSKFNFIFYRQKQKL